MNSSLPSSFISSTLCTPFSKYSVVDGLLLASFGVCGGQSFGHSSVALVVRCSYQHSLGCRKTGRSMLNLWICRWFWCFQGLKGRVQACLLIYGRCSSICLVKPDHQVHAYLAYFLIFEVTSNQPRHPPTLLHVAIDPKWWDQTHGQSHEWQWMQMAGPRSVTVSSALGNEFGLLS